MARIELDWLNYEKTGEDGKDEKGDYFIQRVFGKEYCNCHPETCSHFDGIRHVDYKRKVYKLDFTETFKSE